MSEIAAVRSAFPPHRYPQAELTRTIAELAGLTPSQRALMARLHANSGIDTRHTVLPLEEYAGLTGVGAVNDRYIDAATDLAEQALRSALDAAGAGAAEVDLVIVTSVTGVAVPSLDARLIPRLGLRPDVKRLPIFGLGCVAGAAGLGRLHDYLRGWPQHTAVLVAIELCSLSWPSGEVTTPDLVASGLFGDGSVALVARGEQVAPTAAVRGPRVVASRSEVYPDSGETLGWRLAGDRFRILLTAELSDVVERRLNGSVTAFLAEHDLTIADVTTWVCHPGGPKVIDAVQSSLKLPDQAVQLSRRSLAQVGNLSSASVLHVLEQVLACVPPPSSPSTGLIIGLGPGVSVELILLQW